MTKGKIINIRFTQGTTVTLPQPVGSCSSLDTQRHGVHAEYHPIGIRITKSGMGHAIVVPYPQVLSVHEELEPEVTQEVKRGPGRPAKADSALN